MDRLAILSTSGVHADEPDRLAIVEVSGQVARGWDDAGYAAFREVSLPDASLVWAEYDEPNDLYRLTYYSDAFPLVPAGGSIPLINLASN